MAVLWAEIQRLRTRLMELEAKPQEPVKEARHASVPPSPTRKANTPARPPQGTRREARVGRAGGGRALHPAPDQVIIAKAKRCPPCGHGVPEAGQALQAVYDKSERPPLKPLVTRVEPDGGRCAGCGQLYVAPVPTGMEPGTPLGPSVQRLATSLRSTPASSDERWSGLFAQVCGLGISEGGLAPLFQAVHGRLDARVAAILTRLRSRRLIGSDETSARVSGQQPWAWVFQHPAVCSHVLRPSRGQGVSPEVLGAPRPTRWGSDLSSAPQHHPAEPWQVCGAHPVRDGQVAIDAGDAVWAPRMQAVFRRALALHKRRDTLAVSTLSQDRGDLHRRVTRGLALQPTTPHGRRRQKREATIQDHWFLLLDDATIPPTNHSSAHAIRMRTVLRKVTNGCRSQWGRDLCAAVRSLVNTGKRLGLSAYPAIQKALAPRVSLFEPG